MKLSFAGILVLAIGVLIVITPWYIFPVCEVFGIYAKTATGTNLLMPCGYTARAELGVGTVLALCGSVLLVSRTPQTRKAIGGFPQHWAPSPSSSPL